MPGSGLRLGSPWAQLLSPSRGSHGSRQADPVRINSGAYQVRYIGPDGKRYSKSFSHLEDAKYWQAFERRMMDQGEWCPLRRSGIHPPDTAVSQLAISRVITPLRSWHASSRVCHPSKPSRRALSWPTTRSTEDFSRWATCVAKVGNLVSRMILRRCKDSSFQVRPSCLPAL